jgi:hypothetical protein
MYVVITPGMTRRVRLERSGHRAAAHRTKTEFTNRRNIPMRRLRVTNKMIK